MFQNMPRDRCGLSSFIQWLRRGRGRLFGGVNKRGQRPMSQRNGDRSRFGRERKRKILRRKRYRALRERLGLNSGEAKTPASGK
jgi:hypothetical protein